MKTTIWYRTFGLSGIICEVLVTRVNDKSVWTYDPPLFKGCAGCEKRMPKHSDYQDYWETFEEAEKHVEKTLAAKILYLEQELEELKLKLAMKHSRLIKVKDFKPMSDISELNL